MKRKSISLVLIATLCTPGALLAGHEASEESRNISYGVARVIRVEPIVRTVEIREPSKECRESDVRVYPPRRSSVTGSAIAGGVIGGLLGNSIGRGRGRSAATVGGAVLGAAIGGSVAERANHRGGYQEVRHVQECRIVDRIRLEERTDGYWVDYEYRGDIYRTRLDEHPGKKLRVRVSVEPVAR